MTALRFYYDVVCPYAYMASVQVEALARAAGATLIWEPILLGGVFRSIQAPDSPAERMSPHRARMNLLDISRQAELLGMSIRMPSAHPRRTVDAMRLLVAAPPHTRPDLSRALFEAYWALGLDVADRNVLDTIARKFGINPSEIDSPAAKEGLYANTARAVADGVFGVPGFVVDGRLWWGADRIHLVAQALGLSHWPLTNEASNSNIKGLSLTFFHDFSSPFSYLASTQIERVAAEHGALVQWTPILLGALFRSIGTPDVPLHAMNPTKQRYVAQDLRDWATWWGVPFRMPSVFPIRTVTALRVAILEPETTGVLYQAAWAHDEAIGDLDVLVGVLNNAGFSGDDLVRRTQSPEVKQQLRVNTETANQRGACGVPSYLIDDSWLFWGQDRLDQVGRALAGWRPEAG